jgi:hypothetical protein
MKREHFEASLQKQLFDSLRLLAILMKRLLD